MDTERQVALITGAASGIGYATALHLAEAGWRVALVDRDAGGLEPTLSVLNDRGATALAHAADVTVPPAIEAALAHFDELGPLRGVVNCAGVVANVPVADTTAELLRGVLEITSWARSS